MYKLIKLNSKGRCAIATSNLAAGTTIIVADPVAAVIDACNDAATNLLGYAPTTEELATLRPATANMKCNSMILCRRVLLSLTHTPTYEAVAELCSCLDMRTKDQIQTYSAIAELLCRTLPHAHPHKANVTFVVRLISALSANSFSICNEELTPLGIGLYPSASCLNHSCMPNCIPHFVGVQLRIRTLRPVRRGEELTIPYVELARPSWIRRKELYDSYGFVCMCERCSFPTDDWLQDVVCSKCAGRVDLQGSTITSSLYRSWLSGGSCAKSHSSPLQSALPLPQWVLDCDDENIGGARSDRPEVCMMICSKCGAADANQCVRDLHQASLSYKNSISNHKSSLENCLRVALRVTQKWLHPKGFAMMEVLNALAMTQLNAQNFEEALRYVKKSLAAFGMCYPNGSPAVALQQAFIAKLLAYSAECIQNTSSDREARIRVGDMTRKIRKHAEAAAEILKIIYEDSAVEMDMRSLMMQWR